MWPTFCGVNEAKCHIAIILSVICLSIHPSVCPSVTLCSCWRHIRSVEHWLLSLFLEFALHSCYFKCTWAEGSSALSWSRVVRRPSVVNFSYFRLLWNRWTEFNETWQEARTQHPLPSLCFLGRSEKQDGRPGLWLAETFLTSPLKLLKGIQRNLTGSNTSTSSTKFLFFGPIEIKRWPPWPLIGWDIFDFSSETAEGNSKKLDRK